METYRKEITWTRGDGEKVVVKVKATIYNADGKKAVNLDGHKVEVDCKPTADIAVNVKSKGIGSLASYRHLDAPVLDGKVTACAGRLAITREMDEQIMAATAEAKQVAAKATGREYDDNPNNLQPLASAETIARIERMSGDRKGGACPHCGTYCDGDCQA